MQGGKKVTRKVFLILLALVLALSVGLVACGEVGEEQEEEEETYELTIESSAGGLVTTPGEGTHTYEAGRVVDLVAEAEEGYRFATWTGDVDTIYDVNDTTTTITMDASYSIEAKFEAIPPTQYTLTISSTEGGSVTDPGEPGPYTYDEGEEVDLVAEADEGYRFIYWSGDADTVAGVNDATTTMTMNADYAITAIFGAERVVVYDFVAEASDSRTTWESGTGESVDWTLTFPGATNDNRGFACYQTDVVLEDDQSYDKVLETHPQWVDDGFIRGEYVGLYDMDYTIEIGDRFYAKVGLFKNATAGNVKFVVWIIVAPGYAAPIAEISDSYDGTLQTIDVDLSPYANRKAHFILRVDANGSSAQDWAAWVEAKIIDVGEAISSGTITIGGTESFDFDAGVVGEGNENVDVWWHILNSTSREMTPRNGATIVNLGVVDFSAITPADLMELTYGTTPIDGSDVSNALVPGDVFAVHTNAGNYAKARVLTWGYSITIEWVTY